MGVVFELKVSEAREEMENEAHVREFTLLALGKLFVFGTRKLGMNLRWQKKILVALQ